jgi:hypothetical protein
MLYMLDEVASTEDPAEASPDADMKDSSEPEGDDMQGVIMSERNVSGVRTVSSHSIQILVGS